MPLSAKVAFGRGHWHGRSQTWRRCRIVCFADMFPIVWLKVDNHHCTRVNDSHTFASEEQILLRVFMRVDSVDVLQSKRIQAPMVLCCNYCSQACSVAAKATSFANASLFWRSWLRYCQAFSQFWWSQCSAKGLHLWGSCCCKTCLKKPRRGPKRPYVTHSLASFYPDLPNWHHRASKPASRKKYACVNACVNVGCWHDLLLLE